jgi:hypothetical protein
MAVAPFDWGANPELVMLWEPDASRAQQISLNGRTYLTGATAKRLKSLAGAGGFEPPHGGIKIRCLTTWLRPNAVAA